METVSSEISRRVIRTSWRSKDLEIICAFLNSSNGGEIVYNVKERDTVDAVLSICTAVKNKLKKIGPDIHGLVDIITGEIEGKRFVKVVVKPSSTECYVTSRSGNKTYYIEKDNKRIKTSREAISQEKDKIKETFTKDVKNERKPGPYIRKSISKLTPNMQIPDTNFVVNHTFLSGNTVPIYEAFSVYGFNRLVGYLKYLNRTYANVYCRGECKLHESLIPSLYRGKDNLKIEDRKINLIINRFLEDNKMLDYLGLDPNDKERSQYRIESVLQHYGATTSFLDVVDNHWVALWMGLNRYIIVTQTDKYAKYVERTIPLVEKISGAHDLEQANEWDKNIYQYVLLIAVPFANNPSVDGINKSNDIIEIDLRKSLPSTFLRPHAQHGLVIKKNVLNSIRKSEDYDLSTNVVAIIKIRIDRAKQWIGDGELLTQDNLIPPPGYDPGYDLLLSKYDLFRNSSLKITKYM